MIRILGALALVGLTACAAVGKTPNEPAAGALPAAAKKSALLYAVDQQLMRVDIFTYPQGQPAGQIQFDYWVGGSCLGLDGTVWIADGSFTDHPTQVERFQHGATTPDTTIDGPGENPVGCSQDASTHDLAVATQGGEVDKPLLAVFPDAPKYTAVKYTPVTGAKYLYCAYDGHGNLFVDGVAGSHYTFFLIELKKGAKTFTTITTDPAITQAGGMVWSQGYLLLAGGSGTSIYRMQISGSKAKAVETTTLQAAANLGYEFALNNDVIVGAPLVDSNRYGFGYWKYPVGGQPTNQFTVGEEFISFTVSR